MGTNKILLLITLLPLCLACKTKNSNYDASGVFEATEVIISAEGNGKLMRFNLNEGDPLTAGQTVGYIDTVQLHLQKLQLTAVTKATGSRRMDVPRQIASLEQQIATQTREQRRFQNLVQAGAANQKQVDDITSQLSVLQAQLVAQRETLEKNNQSLTEEENSQEVQISLLEDHIAKSVIRTPLTGTVLNKYAEEGELVIPGKALFKIADMDNMYLRAYLTSGQLTTLQAGQTVSVYADFGEKEQREYTGTITWISDKAEFTPKTIQTRDERANLVYAVKISVQNDGYLKKGMYGEVRF